jgi:TRAF3-interacting protein 1
MKETGIILGSRRKKKAASAAAAAAVDGGGDAPFAAPAGLGGVAAAGAGGDKPAKEVSKADVNKIREHVQQLVQSTNPLGKAMDMLQEDIESMQKEMQFWSRERKSCGRGLSLVHFSAQRKPCLTHKHTLNTL